MSDALALAFPASTKLRWLEALALDNDVTPFDVRVAVVVSSRTDRASGQARISQVAIASSLKASDRGVRGSLGRLEHLGYLAVDRNAVGDGADGRQAFGGRGGTTSYKPTFPVAGDPDANETPEWPFRDWRPESRNGGSANPERRFRVWRQETRNGRSRNPEWRFRETRNGGSDSSCK